MNHTFFSSWIKPLRLRSAEGVANPTGDARHASWFELFFDLVFVLAIAQLSRLLQADTSLIGFARFAGLFIPIWWAWVIYVFYADRFDTDDVIYRFAVMLGMLAIGAMSTTLSSVFADGAVPFVVCYLIVRLVPLLLYIRAARHVPIGRKLAVSYGGGSLLAACFWVSSLWLLATPWHYLLWAIAVAIELAPPLVARRYVSRTPMDVPHISERFGLFTIIVLGELVVTVGSELTDAHWQLAKALAAAAAFVIAGCLWWIYFELNEAPPIQGRFWTTQVFVFGHLLVLLALTMVAAGAKLAIGEVGQARLSGGSLTALAGGIALYLGTLTVIRIILFAKPRHPVSWVRLGAAAILVALIVWGQQLAPLFLLGLLASVSLIQVLFKLIWVGWEKQRDHAAA